MDYNNVIALITTVDTSKIKSEKTVLNLDNIKITGIPQKDTNVVTTK